MAKATYLRVEWDDGSVWTAEGDTAEKMMEWYLMCESFCCITRRFGYEGPQPTITKKEVANG